MKQTNIHKDLRLRSLEGKSLQGDQLVHNDVVGSIAIHYHASGELSISGNIADLRFALRLLEIAQQTLKGKLTPEAGVIVPARDVDITQNPNFPTIPAGDMK